MLPQGRRSSKRFDAIEQFRRFPCVTPVLKPCCARFVCNVELNR